MSHVHYTFSLPLALSLSLSLPLSLSPLPLTLQSSCFAYDLRRGKCTEFCLQLHITWNHWHSIHGIYTSVCNLRTCIYCMYRSLYHNIAGNIQENQFSLFTWLITYLQKLNLWNTMYTCLYAVLPYVFWPNIRKFASTKISCYSVLVNLAGLHVDPFSPSLAPYPGSEGWGLMWSDPAMGTRLLPLLFGSVRVTVMDRRGGVGLYIAGQTRGIPTLKAVSALAACIVSFRFVVLASLHHLQVYKFTIICVHKWTTQPHTTVMYM